MLANDDDFRFSDINPFENAFYQPDLRSNPDAEFGPVKRNICTQPIIRDSCVQFGAGAKNVIEDVQQHQPSTTS